MLGLLKFFSYRIMGYNEWLKDFFATWEYLRRMAKNVLTKDINGLETII